MTNVLKVNGYSAKYAKLCMDILLGTLQVIPAPAESTVYLSTQEQDFDINQVGVPVDFRPYVITHFPSFWDHNPPGGYNPVFYYSNNDAFEFPRPIVDYGYIISLFVIPVGTGYKQEWGGLLTTGVDIFANDIPAFLPGDLAIGFSNPI